MRIDTLFLNGNVLTVDDRQPRAEALAVLGDRVVAVGDSETLRDDVTAGRVVDLQGKTVVPGFHDAHNHMVFFGRSLEELGLQSPGVSRVEQIYDLVAAEAARRPAGSWIVGAGYDQNRLAGRAHPTAAALDRVAPDHLVWLRHTSGHMCVVNGPVLDRIGFGGPDPVALPEGAVVVRGPDGTPTGLLQERAQDLVRDLVYPYPQDEIVAAIERAGRRYLEEGITSCQEAGIGAGLVGWSPLELAAYQRARTEGRLPVRVTLMVGAEALHDVARHHSDVDGYALDLGIHSGLGDETLRIGPVKTFADGSLIGRTAAMVDDFADDPGNRGHLQMAPERLREILLRAHRSGWQLATHAIGDRAVGAVLDIYEEALRTHPRPDHRHRIEHCAVASPEQVDRIVRLGVIPVPQGRFVTELGDAMLAALGPERGRWCYRQRSFLDRGVPLPGSSDRPVVQGAPLLGLHDLVNTTTASGAPYNPQEALTAEQALRCYTLGSAFAAFEEHRKGSLEPGKLADFTVLSDDITAVPAETIRELSVLATVVGGEVRHDALGLG
jgi:predicted amidohydrolase YtcJ